MIVGVLGGGQLARMLALAGYPLGLKFRTLDPDSAAPAGAVSELVVGAYDDPSALERFVRGVDVVTYEFENVPAKTAAWLKPRVPVFPDAQALATAQDRIAEKTCFSTLGIAVPPFASVESMPELLNAAERIGLPAVLKTRRLGYDGKGQAVVRTPAALEPAFLALGGGRAPNADLILEGFVPFVRELSMVCVRSRSGEVAVYPPIENVHRQGILARSTAPAVVTQATAKALEDAARRVLEHLQYVGVLAIEFFDLGPATDAGTSVGQPRILANEMAPRVHNSGHWTIEGADTSQFENHMRAVCGLPLGSCAPRGQSIMLNVIGDDPDMAELLRLPGVHVHMYGKSPRPGRKLGHVTITHDVLSVAQSLADQAACHLRNC